MNSPVLPGKNTIPLLFTLAGPACEPCVQGLLVSFRNKLKNGPGLAGGGFPPIPGGYSGIAPKLMVRFVTAVPMGTPGKSFVVRIALLKYVMLRALDAATSMLKTVASCIRRRPIKVPSRSATAITILVLDPRGKRIA